MLFGWVSTDPRDTAAVLRSMAAALRTTASEQSGMWTTPTFGIGILELPCSPTGETRDPARAADGSAVWMSGEAFDWPSQGGVRDVVETRGVVFRQRVLDALMTVGPEAIRDLDGEYQIAFWNARDRSLSLLNDRFAALPLYVASGKAGVAFAGGVRGVLVAPGIAADPDVDAIREAVSFGGYRLGGRTNIRGVEMVPPASVMKISADGVTTRRYWTWAELHDGDATDPRATMEEMRAAWTAAVRRRLRGAARPGLTLSGGLDSRAILAEASRQDGTLTALTYGVPHADDVTIARRAARVAGARWQLYPLYSEGWLERRTQRIHETDGLMDLVDLMHAEPLPEMPAAFDVYLSGYIGDAVAGSTLYFANRPEDFLATMPYYGGTLAIPFPEALARAEQAMACTPGAPRFACYEHKLPQSTNRITAAARPFAVVRRPFVDYRFFDICQRVPASWRARHHWREQWLVSTYPEYFARIPNQQTGVPLQASRLRWQMTRTVRYGWRRALAAARAIGLPVVVPDRSYHPDDRYWSRPPECRAIESTVLRRDSLSCEVFGRDRVTQTLTAFFSTGAAPVQVIGALYVFEHYHQTLAASLAEARREARSRAC